MLGSARTRAALALLATFALAACGDEDSTTTETSSPQAGNQEPLTMDYISVPIFVNAFEWVAHSEDYYSDLNLTVNSVAAQSGATPTQAVCNGQVDAALIGFTTTIPAMAAGCEATIVSQGQVGSDFQLVLRESVAQELDIEGTGSLDELTKLAGSGAKIATFREGGAAEELTRFVFAQAGLDADNDLELVPVGDAAAALAAYEQDRIDGFAWLAPTIYQAEDAVLIPIGQDPEIRKVTFAAVVASNEALASDPDAIGRFVEANYRAQQFLHDTANEDRVVEVASEALPDVDASVLTKSYEDTLPSLPEDLCMSEGRFADTMDYVNATLEEPVDIGYSEAFDPTYCEAAMAAAG